MSHLAETPVHVGQLLDQKYELRQLLGRGGSGEVYLARHVYMERDVAIKLLHPSLAEDESLRARFFREARLTSLLRHPNIVTVHDFGVSDGAPYLVMEHVNGVTLRSYLNEKRALEIAELTSIVVQICSALVAAHELGVVHRDLKPENVLLIRDQSSLSVRVLDFGIAKIFASGEGDVPRDEHVTEEGIFQGTPRYAAPEQIRNLDVDGRADLYSLGVLLYELLVGCPPFDSSSSIELAMMHLNSPVIPPRSRDEHVECPDSLEAVIMRCLKKRPEDRFASAEEALDALERFGRREQVLPARRSPLTAGLAVLGVAMICLSVFWSSNSVARPRFNETEFQVAPAQPMPHVEAPSADDLTNGLLSEGQRAFHRSEYTDAAPMFRSVLARRPNDATAKIYLALCYKKTGRFDESIAVLESLDPTLQADQKVSYQLALLNAKIGKMDEALQHLAEAAKGNKSIKERAKSEPAFAPLAQNQQYRKIIAEDRPASPSKETRRGSRIERGFGRMLESVNRGINHIFG
ncbi:MAG: protein kinase [Bdellovibrionota bacterium]